MHNNHVTEKHMPKTSAKQSPRDTKCLYCGKLCTAKSVYEHERHHCPKNPHRKKRKFGKAACRICGKMYHAAGLRTHMATQHPLDFAKEKSRKRSSSKAAMRRRVARAESEERRHQEVPRSPPPRRPSFHATSSPHGEKHRYNTESNGMAQIQREMHRFATAN